MRADLEIIQQWVKPGHHVLDLGCGDGTLLDYLKRERNATGFGLEINPDHITTCMNRGVSVIEQNLDTQGLDNFERSEEHTSELQSRPHLVCRLLLEKKKK